MSKITIIGMGLIGTSLGMALKKAQVGAEIVGSDQDIGVANRALKARAVDKTESNLLRAVRDAQLVIIATPVNAIGELLKAIGSELQEGCIVTDTGSTKGDVLSWAEEHLPRTVSFVGGHPIAGKEMSGPEAAQADLFQGANYCIMPGKYAQKEAVRVVVDMVEAVGAKPYFIDTAEHDSFVGAISHLPMILSTVLMKTTSSSPFWPEISKLAATGYRDVTRLASGEPTMNRDICLTNQESILRWIDEFIKEMYAFRGLVEEGDDSLWKTFDAAWEARDRWLQSKVTTPAPFPQVDTPTTAESMGSLVLGDRSAGRAREMFDWYKDDKGRRPGR
jgi:prephenate dehydrogenase